MDIVSLCPLPASGFVWQPHAGGFAQTVLVKATFVLRPGESVLAPDQDPLHKEDKHWENTPTRSVYAPSDWAPFKPKADVMLVGHAYAPGQQPVRSLMVRLVVGELDKSIEVWCDRGFRVQDGQLLEGPRFTKQALAWERAAGGPETNNPVGMRFDAAPDMYGMVAVPNLQPPGMFVTQRSDTFPPMSFAPVAERWPERVTRLGSAARAFAAKGWEGLPLPEGFNYSYFQAGPMDQQVRELRANERLVLENLHADHERLVTNLPGIKPKAVAERATGEQEDVALVADALWIDTDRRICTLVWRGRIGLRHAMEAGRIAVSVDPTSIEAATAGGLNRKVAPPKDDAVQTLGPEFVELDVSEDVSTMTIAPALGAALGNARALPFAGDGEQAGTLPAERSPGLQDNAGGLPFGREPGSAGAIRPQIPPPVSMAAQGTMLASLGATEGVVAPPVVLPAAAPASPPPAAPVPVPSMVNPPPLVAPPPRIEPLAPPAAASPWAGGPRSLIADQSQPPLISAKPYYSAEAAAVVGGDEAGRKRRWKTPLRAESSNDSTAGRDIAEVARMGAVAASNAAADSHPRERVAEGSGRSVQAAPRDFSKEIVELLWFDPAYVPRLRRKPAWKEIMTQVKPTPLDDDFPGEAPPDKRQELRDRREVFGLLARGEPLDARGIDSALAEAVRDDGTFVPPIVLVRGELEFPFDELETLKATIAAITPLTAGDKRLKEAVDTTQELLQTPWLTGASSVTEGLTAKLKDVFAQGNRMLPARYLENHTERMLLEQRAYQVRTVLGKPCIRSLLTIAGSQISIPVYLPDSLRHELPGFQRFSVRMLAELRVQLDQLEAQTIAMRTLALGRILSELRKTANLIL